MGVVAAFIDGGYLDKITQFEKQRVDYQKLVAEMAGNDELLRAHYYHCMPYQSDPATAEESERFAKMDGFLAALRRLPRFEIRLGRLALRGKDAEGNPIFVQKRVDNMVGVDMAILAGKGKINRLALLSGDSDFIPSVEVVKREGVVVTLWHGRSGIKETAPSRELFDLCDERRELTPDYLRRVARPAKPSN
jgi:uncharacterized LabA/DUF88 family protein